MAVKAMWYSQKGLKRNGFPTGLCGISTLCDFTPLHVVFFLCQAMLCHGVHGYRHVGDEETVGDDGAAGYNGTMKDKSAGKGRKAASDKGARRDEKTAGDKGPDRFVPKTLEDLRILRSRVDSSLEEALDGFIVAFSWDRESDMYGTSESVGLALLEDLPRYEPESLAPFIPSFVGRLLDEAGKHPLEYFSVHLVTRALHFVQEGEAEAFGQAAVEWIETHPGDRTMAQVVLLSHLATRYAPLREILLICADGVFGELARSKAQEAARHGTKGESGEGASGRDPDAEYLAFFEGRTLEVSEARLAGAVQTWLAMMPAERQEAFANRWGGSVVTRWPTGMDYPSVFEGGWWRSSDFRDYWSWYEGTTSADGRPGPGMIARLAIMRWGESEEASREFMKMLKRNKARPEELLSRLAARAAGERPTALPLTVAQALWCSRHPLSQVRVAAILGIDGDKAKPGKQTGKKPSMG